MMTFRFAKCTVAVGVIGLAAVLPSDAQAASATATATVTINAAISMAKTVDMSFGTIGTTAIAGTVDLGTDGSRTCTDVECLGGSPGAAASFNVTGDNGATYSVTLSLMAFWIGWVGAPRLVAYALTHIIVLIVGVVLNRRWVFRATAGRSADQGIRFVLAQVGFRTLDWVLYTVIELLAAPPASTR